jgi:hypothetical protein
LRLGKEKQNSTKTQIGKLHLFPIKFPIHKLWEIMAKIISQIKPINGKHRPIYFPKLGKIPN